MVIKARGEFVDVSEQINLTVQIKDSTGTPVDADSYPQISLIQPSGLVALAPTSVGVGKIGTGNYSYTFTVPINGPYGVWNDVWSAYISAVKIETSFQFIVSHTEIPGMNSDGYIKLGDDPGFNYSQVAIANINKLLKSLKARLSSSGKSKATDSYGNVIYVDCDIFSTDMLVTFLGTALWDFNQVPFFTTFDFDDDNFVNQFGEILVEGATLYSLASKMLLERGREFNITDNSINFVPPTVSELMNTQYSTLLTHYWEKLRMIKNSLRPSPQGLGVFSMTNSGINPAIARLRHLRERQII